jgi:hypothetical protein
VVREKRRRWYHFLTTTCAIIGGVFTVAGILDGILYSTFKMAKKVGGAAALLLWGGARAGFVGARAAAGDVGVCGCSCRRPAWGVWDADGTGRSWRCKGGVCCCCPLMQVELGKQG